MRACVRSLDFFSTYSVSVCLCMYEPKEKKCFVLFMIFVSFITEITEIVRIHASQHISEHNIGFDWFIRFSPFYFSNDAIFFV